MTGYGLHGRCSIPRRGTNFSPSLDIHNGCNTVVPAPIYPGVHWLEHDAYHPHLPNGNLQNAWVYNSMSPLRLWG